MTSFRKHFEVDANQPAPMPCVLQPAESDSYEIGLLLLTLLVNVLAVLCLEPSTQNDLTTFVYVD